jgi:SagB-type dehydrogenase family enzyme
MGVYRYDPEAHELILASSGDIRKELMKAAGDQHFVGDAPMIVVLAANYNRVAREYGGRAERLVHIEAGHVGQNICLQATALGLGVIGVGSFCEADLKAAMNLPSREDAVYMVAAGWKY